MFSKASSFSGSSIEPLSPPGLLLLGGLASDGPLSSVETFGFEDDECRIPQLPEPRYGLAAFKTSSNQLAVCGGWWEGKPDSTDCLTLDMAEAQWVRGTLKGNLFGEGVRGSASFDGVRTYIFHSKATSYLESGSDTWVLGPESPVETECGCRLSDSSYAIIGSNSGNNVLEYSVTKKKWEPIDTWPEMRTKRKGPGCAATPYYLLVAGGVTDAGEVLATVEILWVKSKSLGRGQDMSTPRSFFNLVPVGLVRPKILAVGGRYGTLLLKSSEFWEEEENLWEEGPELGTGRSSLGAIMIEAEHVCTKKETVPPHSCPAMKDEIEETCSFANNSDTASYISLAAESIDQGIKTCSTKFTDNFSVQDMQPYFVRGGIPLMSSFVQLTTPFVTH